MEWQVDTQLSVAEEEEEEMAYTTTAATPCMAKSSRRGTYFSSACSSSVPSTMLTKRCRESLGMPEFPPSRVSSSSSSSRGTARSRRRRLLLQKRTNHDLPAQHAWFITSKDESPWLPSPVRYHRSSSSSNNDHHQLEPAGLVATTSTTGAAAAPAATKRESLPPTPIPFRAYLHPATVASTAHKRARRVQLYQQGGSATQHSIFSCSLGDATTTTPADEDEDESEPSVVADDAAWSERWSWKDDDNADHPASALVFRPLVNSLRRDGFSPDSCRLHWTTLAVQSESLELAPAMHRLQARLLGSASMETTGSAPPSTLEWLQRLHSVAPLQLDGGQQQQRPPRCLSAYAAAAAAIEVRQKTGGSMDLAFEDIVRRSNSSSNGSSEVRWERLPSQCGVLDVICIIEDDDDARFICQQGVVGTVLDEHWFANQPLVGRVLSSSSAGQMLVDCKFVSSTNSLWIVRAYYSQPRAHIEHIARWLQQQQHSQTASETISLRDFHTAIQSSLLPTCSSWAELLQGMRCQL